MREALIHLYAVFSLLRLDAKALNYMDTTPRFIRKSLVVPVLMTLFQTIIFSYLIAGEKAELFTTQVWITYFFVFNIGWIVYLLLVQNLTRLIDREKSFLGYVVAFCWAIPLQTLILVPVFIMRSLEIGNLGVQGFFFSLAVVFVYFLHWSIAKTALKLGNFGAIGFVMLFDLCTSFIPTLIVHIYASGVPLSQSLS